MSNISGFVKRLRDIMRSDPGINGDAQRIEQIAWLLFLKVYSAKEEEWKANDKNYVSIIPEEIQWKNWAQKNGLTGDDLLKFVNETVFPKLKEIKVSKDTEIRKAIVYTTFADANQYMKDGVSLRQLAELLEVTPAAACEMVDALVQKKVVVREKDSEDRRAVSLRIVPEHFRKFEEIEKNLDQVFADFLTDFPADRREMALELMDQLIGSLQKRVAGKELI